MNKKIKGVLLGVAGALLWFAPFSHFQLFGLHAYSSGEHAGDFAYLLPIASISFAVLCWLGQFRFALIAAIIATVLSSYFALQAGSSIGWGLIALLVISLLSVMLAMSKKKR